MGVFDSFFRLCLDAEEWDPTTTALGCGEMPVSFRTAVAHSDFDWRLGSFVEVG